MKLHTFYYQVTLKTIGGLESHMGGYLGYTQKEVEDRLRRVHKDKLANLALDHVDAPYMWFG